MVAAIAHGAGRACGVADVCDGFGVALRRSTLGGGSKSVPSAVVHAVAKCIWGCRAHLGDVGLRAQ